MSVYYNEIDGFAADWLRKLIAAGHLPDGYVDERDIRVVQLDDLNEFVQCHFFAGIGGWPLALRMAGWPDDEPVWTGSCPCQPFSQAGKRGGFTDARHLWPEWFRLIRQCRPATVFGEQVAGPDGLRWLDLVSSDLEGEGYAVGAADLCAASVGAPHIRQRLFWVGHAEDRWPGRKLRELAEAESDGIREISRERSRLDAFTCCGTTDRVAHRIRTRLEKRQEQSARQERAAVERSGNVGRLGDSKCELAGRNSGAGAEAQGRTVLRAVGDDAGSSSADPWSDLEWLPCIDGKARPTQPGLFPLAHGVSGRVGRLRAYGNAIVPQVAAEFIWAACGAVEDTRMFA